MQKYNKIIFDYQTPGHCGFDLPQSAESYNAKTLLAKYGRHQDLLLPSATELEVVRHYTNLSFKNFGVESGFYPLGSCTMKYNPKINEDIAALPTFQQAHPLDVASAVQGSLKVLYDLGTKLQAITGMAEFTFEPCAGAHGELTGLMIIKQYHWNRHDEKRHKIIVPDSAHGTNPASSNVCSFDVVSISSNRDGRVNLDSLKAVLDDEVAGIMLTNPNTLGMFEKDILEITKLVHQAGGLVYYDGANLNALLGKVKPAEMGFDVLHLNLHKSFGTPHGGGGPGSGPVGVIAKLQELLPNPHIKFDGKQYYFENNAKSCGRVSGFYGNFGVCLKALAYLDAIGSENLAKIADYAVLNANYIKENLKSDYQLWITEPCKHEVVFAGLKEANGVTTLDVAKRLLDYGYHAPTIYFPLIVDQAMMIEPTESEDKETLDEFVTVMKKIAKEAREQPELVKSAPHETQIKRIDEVRAAREPILNYRELKTHEG